MHNYRMAVTEREVAPIGSRFVSQKDLTIISHLQVINGCISQTNSDVRDHVIIYTRILQVRISLITVPVQTFFPQNINLQNLKRASAFIDIQDRWPGSWKF